MEDLDLYTISCITIAIILLFRANKSRRHLPPGPMGLPIIGNLHILGPSLHKSLQKLSQKFGPLLKLSLGSVPCVVVSSPETAREFLRTQEISFSNRPTLGVLNYLSYPSADFTFAEHGPYWKLMKKLCMTRLLGAATLERLLPIRQDEIRLLLERFGTSTTTKRSIEVRKELTKMTSNVISRMIFGRRISGENNEEEAEEIEKIVGESTEVLGEFNLSDYIWICKWFDFQGLKKKSLRIHERFDNIMEKIIKDRVEARKKRNNNNGFSDLLDILLDVSEEEDHDEIKLTKDHIKAFVLDSLVAGTDTSSITIEWALAELINHPNIMKKAREELDLIVGQTRLVEESDIPNLPYIQAIVRETLRLHPPGPILFRASSEKKTTTVSFGPGYEIPGKTTVLVNVWAIQRDPEFWENPLEFRPERFLKDVVVKGRDFDFLPFGSGRRGCPGSSLGLQVSQTALAAMIQCFDWKFEGKDGIVCLDEEYGFTLPMACPLFCTTKPRFHPIPI